MRIMSLKLGLTALSFLLLTACAHQEYPSRQQDMQQHNEDQRPKAVSPSDPIYLR